MPSFVMYVSCLAKCSSSKFFFFSSEMPHNYLPVLEVNGTQISQSLAIVQFVAKEVREYFF